LQRTDGLFCKNARRGAGARAARHVPRGLLPCEQSRVAFKKRDAYNADPDES
jgi:hypothetical protein